MGKKRQADIKKKEILPKEAPLINFFSQNNRRRLRRLGFISALLICLVIFLYGVISYFNVDSANCGNGICDEGESCEVNGTAYFLCSDKQLEVPLNACSNCIVSED